MCVCVPLVYGAKSGGGGGVLKVEKLMDFGKGINRERLLEGHIASIRLPVLSPWRLKLNSI